MHAKLKITLTAAALATAVPAAGIANAHEGQRGGKGSGKVEAKHGAAKPGKGCERRGGRGYEAQGLLAAGSSLEQVAGADTARRGDDRFSGTLIVEVRQGNRRGRQDKGLTSYAVERVRALGTGDDAVLPPVGTRVLLVGKVAKVACPAPTTSPEPSPEPTATPAPDDTASAARASRSGDDDDPEVWDEDDRRSGGKGDDSRKGGDDDSAGDDSSADDDSGSEYPSSTTPAPTTPAAATASAAVIKLVVFKDGKRARR